MIRRLTAAVPLIAAAVIAVLLRSNPLASALVVVAAAAYAVLLCIRWAYGRGGTAEPSAFAAGRRPAQRPASGLPEVARLGNAISLSHQSMADYDMRLRPALLRAAQGRLRARGMSQDDPRVAEEVFGADVWALLAPPPPGSIRRDVPGPSIEAVERVVKRLEET